MDLNQQPIEQNPSIILEAELQNFIRKGFKILRMKINPYQIEMKKQNSHGWQYIDKFDSLAQMNERIVELGQQDKILIFNEQWEQNTQEKTLVTLSHRSSV